MKFQGLLQWNEDKSISGPMSPILFAKEVSKELDFKFDGLCRLIYGDNYSHLIFRKKYKNRNWYCMIIDTGTHGIPVGMWFDKDSEATLTKIYRRQFEEQTMKDHYGNCEKDSRYDEYPIIEVDEEELVTIFQQAEESGELNVGSYEKV